MSLPNQNAAEGSRVRRAGASAVGSTVPSQGASSAISSIVATSAPPTAIAGWRHRKPRKPRRILTGGKMSGNSGAAAKSDAASPATTESVANAVASKGPLNTGSLDQAQYREDRSANSRGHRRS